MNDTTDQCGYIDCCPVNELNRRITELESLTETQARQNSSEVDYSRKLKTQLEAVKGLTIEMRKEWNYTSQMSEVIHKWAGKFEAAIGEGNG